LYDFASDKKLEPEIPLHKTRLIIGVQQRLGKTAGWLARCCKQLTLGHSMQLGK
jgi:hypothetical protein